MEQPEAPRCEPPVTFPKGSWDDRVVEYTKEDRPVITLLDNPSQSHCELKIAQLLQANADRVLKCPSQQKERRSIL